MSSMLAPAIWESAVHKIGLDSLRHRPRAVRIATWTLLILIGALVYGVFDNASAQSLVSDGTFLNPMGDGENLMPWSDWTNAGIATHPAHSPIPGNYASLPMGADLFTSFSQNGNYQFYGPPLPNGNYQLSFLSQNQSSWDAELVFAIEQALGTPIATGFATRTAEEVDLPASSGFIPITFDFTIDNPPFVPNQLYFSNSYDAPDYPIGNSINPSGTIINIADVSLQPVPEPSTLILLLSSVAVLGFVKNDRRRKKPNLQAP
jgi:hypothetical protein